MMARTRMIALTTLAVAFGLLAVAGAASAQEAQANINCDQISGEIRPLGTPGIYDCRIDVEFPGAGGQIQAGEPASFYTITLSTDAPSWADVTLSPSSITGQYNAEGNTHPFTVNVALTQRAPAFQSTSLEIDGSATFGQQNMNVAPTQVTVTPGYFNLYNVRLDSSIGQGGPQDTVQFAITIDNFSNGETRFDFRLGEDSVPEGFQAVTPDPLVLQSEATGGERTRDTVNFEVYTPFHNGYVNTIAAIQLHVESSYAPDTTIPGTTSTISTLTEARGFYVPGPGAALSALAMVGAIGLGSIVRRD